MSIVQLAPNCTMDIEYLKWDIDFIFKVTKELAFEKFDETRRIEVVTPLNFSSNSHQKS